MLKAADNVLDLMVHGWKDRLGLYDRCFITVVVLLGLTNLVYPTYSSLAHLAIPNHAFFAVSWMLVLPFLSLLMFIEAGHWEGTAQLIRLVLALVLLAAFVIMIMTILNSAYAHLYTTPAPAPVPASTPVPSVGIA